MYKDQLGQQDKAATAVLRIHEVVIYIRAPLHCQYLLSIFCCWQYYWLCEDNFWRNWQ